MTTEQHLAVSATNDWARRLAPLAAGALLAAALPQAAAAATWTTTYTGVVSEGQDGSGTFGVGHLGSIDPASLAGYGFTAVFVTDSLASGATLTPVPGGLQIGGAGVVSALFILNGRTLSLGATSGGQTLTDDGLVQGAAHSAATNEQNIQEVMEEGADFPLWYGYRSVASLSLSVTGAGDGNFNLLPAGVIGTGSFYRYLEAYSGATGVGADSSGSLLVTSVSQAYDPGVTGAVPEPGVWALMILGFGAAGAVLRRRGGGAESLAHA